MISIPRELKYAVRALSRQKAWTATAVVTLALGIGANTAMFSVVSGVLLHPLPYPQADRIALPFLVPRGAPETQFMALPDTNELLAWRSEAHSLGALHAFSTQPASFRRRDGAIAELQAAQISPAYAAFAGLRPLLGREFQPADTAFGSSAVVMLSEHVWRSSFGASPGVIGQTVTLDSTQRTIVGVMPDGLWLPRSGAARTPDMWLPLRLGSAIYGAQAVLRLRPGIAFSEATRELEAIRARIDSVSGEALEGHILVLRTPRSLVHSGETLAMLWAAGTLLLLIACVNVAHLLLARGNSRARELAIRVALGASRWRLARELLMESALLVALGTAAGLFVGWAGLRWVRAARPDTLLTLGAVRLDETVIVLTVAISAMISIAFGLLGMPRLEDRARLAYQAAIPAASTRRQRRINALLVVSEVALSTALLIVATLMVRSVAHLQSRDLGFDPDGVYALTVDFDRTGYATASTQRDLLRRLASGLGALPGVPEVSIGFNAPPFLGFVHGTIEAEGEKPIRTGGAGYTQINRVAPRYFRTLKIPLLDGTTFTDSSTSSTQVVINRATAQLLWPGARAIGRRLRVGGDSTWRDVVGVTANAFIAGMLTESSYPAIFEPLSEGTPGQVIARFSKGSDPSGPVRTVLASISTRSPSVRVSSVSANMVETMAPVLFVMKLLTTFTAAALLLTAVGLYGVMAYSVTQRTREIGIRMALGASPREVLQGVLRQGLIMALVGLSVGIPLATLISKLIATQLYGVGRTDPGAFLIGSVLLIGIVILACSMPARRATRVDVVATIRTE